MIVSLLEKPIALPCRRYIFFFFQAEDGIRDKLVTGVQTCALPIYPDSGDASAPWVPEVFGNLTLVNGAILPRADVQPRRYRLRVLNAANGRFYHLRFKDARPFHVIGSDQGLLAAPAKVTS